MAARWTLVVPIKDTAVGKSRLASLGAQRPALARAMALDTVEAALGSRLVGRVVVVTSDPALARAMVDDVAPGRDTSVELVADPGTGLRDAVLVGARAVERGPLAVLTGDLPGLRPDDLDLVLDQAARYDVAVVADADDVGTTLLAVADPSSLDPRFGESSLAAHRAQGAVPIAAPVGLRRDVDLPAHLDELRPLLGPRTASLVARTAVR
ncbi:2-phospho-L-lactate guanylyltransferase [Mumia sp. DW29H23]|uniref:2-phospho-L-lactate guanylyltransferase n=1 Tax=Mumia sp. DW29H23 TaxID=3421241 RepID=UPI003D68274B